MTAAVRTRTNGLDSVSSRTARRGATQDGGHTTDETTRHRHRHRGREGNAKSAEALSDGREERERGRGEEEWKWKLFSNDDSCIQLARRCLLPHSMYPYLDKPVADRRGRQSDNRGGQEGEGGRGRGVHIDHDPPTILTVVPLGLSLSLVSASVRSDAIRTDPVRLCLLLPNDTRRQTAARRTRTRTGCPHSLAVAARWITSLLIYHRHRHLCLSSIDTLETWQNALVPRPILTGRSPSFSFPTFALTPTPHRRLRHFFPSPTGPELDSGSKMALSSCREHRCGGFQSEVDSGAAQKDEGLSKWVPTVTDIAPVSPSDRYEFEIDLPASSGVLLYTDFRKPFIRANWVYFCRFQAPIKN